MYFIYFNSSIVVQKLVFWNLTESAEKTFKLFQSQERELINKYNYVVSLWKRVSEIVLSSASLTISYVVLFHTCWNF